uniref:Nephrocystin-3 n=1 Tax=Ananas comosus var. bracteatus TaxID=296719 RepID=A0A6V7QTG2_ANACO
MIRSAFGKAVAKALRSQKRFYGASDGDGTQHERVAAQMIQYALGHARSQRSGQSYDEAMLVLEQGVSNLGGGGEEGSVDAIGTIMLAMSTLLYERGKLVDAMEKLEEIYLLASPSSAIRVAAWEGLMGLKMEAGQDATSLVLADDTANSTALKLRANTIRGLADLLNGEIEPAKSFFEGFEDCNVEAGKEQVGNVMLSYGEFLHCTGNILLAKDTYEKSLRALENENLSGTSYKAAANMVPEEALLGVSCALGQLLSHSGKFNEAEELLTKALTKAEHHFGSSHPKVGIILTCIGLMFKQKAKSESSSSILVQEGLYRRALDLLKAPTLNSEVTDPQGDKRDIVALARGGYAELLCIQQNRKEEGERMKKWAEAAWRNRRLSLAEALDFSEPSKAAVVDTRICRLL